MINSNYESYFRGEGRYISSLLKLIVFEFGIVIVTQNLVKNKERIGNLVKIYIYSLIILCFLGFIQFLIASFLGYDIFISSHLVEMGVKIVPHNLLFGDQTIRINSLGGEPKGFAMSLITGIIFLFFSRIYSFNIVKYPFQLAFFFFITLLLTLSTGGIALLIILGLLVSIYELTVMICKLKIKKYFLYLILCCLSFTILFSTQIWNILQSRVFDRSDQLLSEESEVAVQTFFKENPMWLTFGSGIGNIHHLSFQYLPESILYYKAGHVFNARYGYSRLISEGGFVGLFLFFVIFFIIYSKLNEVKSYQARYLKTCLFFLFLFFMLRSNYIFSEFLFVLGLSFAFLRFAKPNVDLIDRGE